MSEFVLLRYTATKPYSPDFGADTGYDFYGAARYKIPVIGGTPLARSAIDVINTQSGADVFKIGSTVIDDSLGSIPCPVSSGVKWRKLIFISDAGASIGVPIGLRTNLVAASTAIETALTAAGFNTICIQLQGEEHDALNDIFGVNTTDTLAPNPDPPDTGRGSFYSGQIIYQSDTGASAATPVKVLSNNRTSGAPSAIGSAWTACVGNFATVKSCGTTNRKHRRYIADFQVQTGGGTGDPPSPVESGIRSREIPVKNRAAADVLACGQAIVTDLAGALVCLRYRGESYKLFHRI